MATKKAVKKTPVKKTAKKDKAPFAHAKPRKVVRDSSSGEFTTKSQAKKNPKGTQTETVNVKVKKGALKLPKTLAACADALYTTRAERLAAQNQIKPLAEFEGLLREHLIQNLPKSQAQGIAGKVANAKIETKDIPRVEDEAKFMAYARKKGNEDLVKIVPNTEAIEARLDAGKKIPGVGIFKAVVVRSTKLK